ncbi:MAG: US12 family protein [Polyangiaceae bacterium]|nr:US12 family protein [Polyangiaceae bacterium]
MSGGFEFVVSTGNRDADWQTASTYVQQYSSSGMRAEVKPLPDGSFQVVVNGGSGGAQAASQAPAQPAGGGWGPSAAAPPPAAQAAGWGSSGAQQRGGVDPFAGPGGAAAATAGYGAGAMAGTGGSPGAILGGEAALPLGLERVKYLRKVYGLLSGAMLVAIAAGYACLSFGGTEPWVWAGGKHAGQEVLVPKVVSMMFENPALMWIAFGALVAATFVASWVSKVRYVNVAALFLVAAIMGLDLAPMIFFAQAKAGIGATLTTAPVRDAGIMTALVFVGITGYVFVTRKDFSYLKAMLNIGFWVILGGCLLTFVFHSEVFALAIATGGALLSAGFILYVTSYIFRNSKMDDAVGDALALLVQLRNLFMFLLRIFMSGRD